jgi:hypothetical protein
MLNNEYRSGGSSNFRAFSQQAENNLEVLEEMNEQRSNNFIIPCSAVQYSIFLLSTC